MKITGITAEFNPLHNGHKYIMEEARRISGADAVVVAMSGDFVQRGEPAIISKHERAKSALLNGADLVVEIPVLFCLGNASQYAHASVAILEACLADTIAFGSESGDAERIRQTADNLKKHQNAINEAIAGFIKEGASYPAARAKAYNTLTGMDTEILERPNDVLALEYVMNMNTASPLAIKRIGAAYDQSDIVGGEFQSASAIRSAMVSETTEDTFTNSDIATYMPEASWDILRSSVIARPDDCLDLIRHTLLSSSSSDIEDCPSAGEGLANLLIEGAKSAGSLDELIMHAKSKRYTYTRISRLCMQVLLGIRRSKYAMESPGYIRILGFNDRGRELIARIKENGDIPILTNINKEAEALDADSRRLLALDVHAKDIYNLISGRDMEAETDQRLMPVMV